MRIFFLFVNMEPDRSENFKNATSVTNRSRKLSLKFLHFLPNGRHKSTFGIYRFFFGFLHMGPYGSQHFKTLLLLQNRSRKLSNVS